MINHILGGGGFTARLFREVREKRGLAYGVSTSLVPMRHAALLAGGTATKNERVAESISVIKDEIRHLAAEGPETEELRPPSTISSAPTRCFRHLEQDRRQLLQISIEGLGIDYVDRRNALVDAVTPEDARRVAKRLSAATCWSSSPGGPRA